MSFPNLDGTQIAMACGIQLHVCIYNLGKHFCKFSSPVMYKQKQETQSGMQAVYFNWSVLETRGNISECSMPAETVTAPWFIIKLALKLGVNQK